MRAAVVVLAAVGMLAGCDPSPDERSCRAMLDHYVEMSARGEPAFATIPEIAVGDRLREILAAKHEEKAYGRAVERCLQETSGREMACAMKANIPDEWEACVQ